MPSRGYVELIRTNSNFRRLWLAGGISVLGSWFSVVALYTLVRQLTDSPLALGLVFFTRTMSWTLASPAAGLIADRFDRRKLMIGADVLRALVVLGFLLVDEARELPLLYGFLCLETVIGTVSSPARHASIPNIASSRELLTANALMAGTEASLLAFGAALGGLAAEGLGLRSVFVIDSASFFISALLLSRTRIPQRTEAASGKRPRDALRDVGAGWRYLAVHPRIGRIAVAKAAWAIAGGGLLYMVVLLGDELMPGAPALGIGLLYAARGLGTGLGPIAARAWLPNRAAWPALFGLGMVAGGAAFALVATVPWLPAVVALVTLANMPFGANYTLSTVLLQERTADAFRGRVFAAELMMRALANAVAYLGASLLLEAGLLTLRQGMLLFAALLAVNGVLWLGWVALPELRNKKPA